MALDQYFYTTAEQTVEDLYFRKWHGLNQVIINFKKPTKFDVDGFSVLLTKSDLLKIIVTIRTETAGEEIYFQKLLNYYLKIPKDAVIRCE